MTMRDVELAWVAGLLEGEGSFMLKRAGGRTVRNLPRVTCSMSDLDVIHKLHRVVGFGIVCTGAPHKHTGCVMHRWQSEDRDRVPQLLRELLPYMGERRSAKIREVLAGAAPYGWDGTKRSLRSSRTDRAIVIG